MEQSSEIDESLLACLCVSLHLERNRIRLHETFIQNGGDSLLAIRFSNLIQKSKNLHIGVGTILRTKHVASLLDETRLRILATVPSHQTPQKTVDPAWIANKEEINDKTLDPIQRFPKVIPSTGLPITFIQAGTAHYTHIIPGAAVQHVTQYCFNDMVPRLKAAFAIVMSHYQTFRLKFEVAINPLSIKTSLKEAFHLNWREEQVESLNAEDLEDSFRSWSIEASSEPIFRVLIPSNTSGGRKLSVVHWFFHLSLMDGRSLENLMHYIDILMNDQSSDLKVDDRVFDVVKGLADYHAQHEVAAKAFWATREVPTRLRNHPLVQPLGKRTPSRVRMTSIDVDYPEDVKVFQSRMGCTFEVLVRAAMGLVLAKLQGTPTVSLMSVSSRRSLPIPGIEDAIGSFASSMILTIDVKEDDTASELLEQVFHKVLELDEMSYTDPADGFSIGGLVVISSDPHPHMPWYSGGHQTTVMSPKETLPTIYVGPTGRLRVCFNSEWRTPSEMTVMTDLIRVSMISLGSGTLNVGQCLQGMLPISQRTKVLEWGNCFSSKTTLTGINDDITATFQRQVKLRGEAVALDFCGQQLTYQSLAKKIRVLGQQLREVVAPGSVIMLHADGSINWIVGMFAILLAGCTFSPQSAALPHQLRSQHYAICDAQAFLLPYEDTRVPDPVGCKLRLCVETILTGDTHRDDLPQTPPKPLSIAYICFSSGTTGNPKAIRCTHAGVIALLRDPLSRLSVEPGTRVAQTLAPPFDGALLEVFSALCFGGTLVLKSPSDPFEHLQNVDSLLITPSLATELNPEDYTHVKNIYFCAEVLPQSTANRWSVGGSIVHNAYGPTECHMIATVQEAIKPEQPITIGRPLPSARVYILDAQMQLAPPLVAGEIYISGVQVSLGYIGLEEENSLRFVPDVIWPGDTGRMYRTGDWGYWTTDGQIAFIGRTDRQVKLGGFRVDLNDVQSRLQGALPSKARVAVVVVGDVLGCAISDAPGLTPEEAMATAENTLAPQHVPRVIRCVGTMPVSAFGKVDYRSVAKLLDSNPEA